MAASIILIGPLAAGKSTLAPRLAARLGWTPIELDELRWDYYAEIGYDTAYVEGLKEKNDWATIGRYWKPFEAHSVERVLADYPENHVIGFGAGHSVYDDPELFARAQKALAPYPYVILLMPVPDAEQSAQIARERLAALMPEMPPEGLDFITDINRTFLASPSNARLATHTFYTHGLTPDAMCDAAEALVRGESGL